MSATAAPDLLTQLAEERRNPAEQLVLELTRLRKKGFPFELAWKRALRSIRWPEVKETRRQWKEVIAEGEDYWRTCYQGEGVRLSLGQIIEGMSRGLDYADAA